MAVVKVIELLGESGESWEDAARQVVAEATRTLHGVTSVYIKEFQATVEGDKVKDFRVDAKVSFLVERKDGHPGGGGGRTEREKADQGQGSPA